ncbi:MULTISPECIES: hypothetical protein [unclassified Nocardia]|uniref:hypothetical protein n=1 Tax=unclassified Nocardia TaxID=2637762 RepID=UPI001CE45E5C|nr:MULTISPECIES: hypothetical protein [unclassified Nocardia]
MINNDGLCGAMKFCESAAVNTHFDGEWRSFGLPGDEEEFRAWVAARRSLAQDTDAFDRHRDLVMGYISRIPEASAQGMYPVIIWSDQPNAPVAVAHYEITTLYRYPQARPRRR